MNTASPLQVPLPWQPASRRAEMLFWLAAGALLFINLGATGTWQSEDRWLEIVREMQLRGDYFRPTLNGVLYFDKPLLSYWFIAALSFVFGTLNEWMLRLPSTLAALGVLWATRDLARHLWDRDTALLAGWILLTSFGFVQWARLGEADMENLAASTLAVACYWRNRDAMRFHGYTLFYAILALGAQCKGLTAIVVPVLAIAPDLLRNKPLRHVNVAHIAAIAIGAGLYFLPFLLSPEGAHTAARDAHAQSGLAQVLRENVVRYFAPFDHTEPWYTYFIAIPQYLFPWSLLFVFALIALLKNKNPDHPGRSWLLAATGLIFVFFTLSGSRRNYYILPVLPYCALLCAVYMRKFMSARALRWSAIPLVVGALVELGLALAWPLLQQRADGLLPASLRWAQFGIGAAALIVAANVITRAPLRSRLGAAFGSAFILLGAFFFYQQLIIDGYRSDFAFSRELAALVRAHPDATIATLGDKPGGTLLFYADLAPTVTVLDNGAALRDFLAATDNPKLILAAHRYDRELPEQLQHATAQLQERQYPWEKNNRDKLRAWLIETTSDRR